MRFVAVGVLAAGIRCSFADDPVAPAPFAPNSKWTQANEGGTVTGAGRADSRMFLQGTGSGISGAGGKAVLAHTYVGATAITARMISLDGAGGTGEAGIRMEVLRTPEFGQNIGMRLFFRADGTLRWEARIFSFEVPPGIPVDGLSLPLWLRVQWSGGALTGLYSTDGVRWTAATPALPVTLPPIAFPGLLVSSQGNAAPASGTFDSVWISGGDADDNGIKDGWEMQNFGHLLGPVASEDADGDGTGNLDEWMWGMNPNHQDLKPSLHYEILATDGLRLWLPNYTYGAANLKIEAATTLQGPWVAIAAATSPLVPCWLTATVPADAPNRFFRASIGVPYGDPQPPNEVP